MPVAKLSRGVVEAPRAAAPAVPLPAGTGSAVARAAGQYSGIEAVRVEEILSAVREQKKMLASLVEQVTRWELDGSEVRVYFPRERSTLAELLEGREMMEGLRTVVSRVLGQPLRVCVRLDCAAAGGSRGETPGARRAPAGELRAKFERDPVVRAMLERFGGEIKEVWRRDED
jgi:hypothetical protein